MQRLSSVLTMNWLHWSALSEAHQQNMTIIPLSSGRIAETPQPDCSTLEIVMVNIATQPVSLRHWTSSLPPSAPSFSSVELRASCDVLNWSLRYTLIAVFTGSTVLAKIYDVPSSSLSESWHPSGMSIE